ncbi:diguanylate cyclase [Oleidesulfovibrio sp.]|uniref:diguanylate cyclase n=1 Tax=Oleidesulfovibrio sp. TaxID=2909707 RepID=UPI003A87FEDD
MKSFLLAHHALSSLSDGVCSINMDRKVVFWNRSAEQVCGCSAYDLIGTHCSEAAICPAQKKHYLCCDTCLLYKALQGETTISVPMHLHHQKGHKVSVMASFLPTFSDNKLINGAVQIFTISPSPAPHILLNELQKLRKASLLDPLTAVGNRRYGQQLIKQMDQSQQLYGTPFGIFFIDIDDFKVINDTYGHETGDRVLKVVATTLAATIRSRDTLIRWGGEEFVVFVPNTTYTALGEMAERLRTHIENAWTNVHDTKLKVTVSIGGAFSQNTTALDAIDQADQAMYHSKATGKNKSTLYLCK